MKDVVESKLHNTHVKGKFSALPEVGIDLHHLDIRSAKQVCLRAEQKAFIEECHIDEEYATREYAAWGSHPLLTPTLPL